MLFTKGNLTYVWLIVLIAVQLSATVEVINCVQCSGTGDTKCGNVLTPTPCSDETQDGCFTKVDTSGVVSRGCIVKSTPGDCTAANNCQISDAGLNTQLVCKTCETSDADCSQTDMTSFVAKNIQFCDATQSKCRINVNDKRVERGCATAAQVTPCTDAQTCKVCDTDFCNTGIFPTNRRNCYQCSGSTCNDVIANQKSLPCLNYVADDQCYTFGDSANSMKRGCKSDDSPTSNPNECTATKDGCLFCSTDNCNDLKYLRDQTRKCYQCNGSATDNECYKEQTSGDYKNCEKQIKYSDTEYCSVHVDAESIKRGCLHDTELTAETCKDDDDCTKCSDTDGCNSKAVSTEFSCIRCRSDEESRCWNLATSLTGAECRNGNSSASEGCFHGIWNGVAIRGCYIDADERQQYVCKDDNNAQCHMCYKKDCNTELTSVASTIKMYFSLWLMILATLWYFK